MPDEQYRVLKVTPKPPSLPVRIAKKGASEVRREAVPTGKKGDGEKVEAKGNKTGAGSGVDIIRGSSEIPLSPYGLEQALEVAKRTKGSFTRVISSPLMRAQQTAKAIMETNPEDLPWLEVFEAAAPWFCGVLEGKPTLSVIDKMNNLIVNHPDKVSPGRGPQSIHDGQSFSEFKERWLRFLVYLIDSYDEDEKVLVVCHFRNIRVVQAWIAAGALGNFDIDTDVMIAKPTGDGPADLFHLNPTARILKKVTNAKDRGIFLLRHGSTEFNAENRGAPTPNAVEEDEEK